jgi:hypothetical protein
VKAPGEFFLRQVERAADQLDLRRAFHALEVGATPARRAVCWHGGDHAVCALRVCQ